MGNLKDLHKITQQYGPHIKMKEEKVDNVYDLGDCGIIVVELT